MVNKGVEDLADEGSRLKCDRRCETVLLQPLDKMCSTIAEMNDVVASISLFSIFVKLESGFESVSSSIEVYEIHIQGDRI